MIFDKEGMTFFKDSRRQKSTFLHSTSCKYSTSWKCSLHLVYIFIVDWDFLIKFCNFDSSFNRNILRSLYINLKHLRMHTLQLYWFAILFAISYLLIFWHDMNFELTWGYILINKVFQWFYQLDQVTFLKKYILVYNCTLFFFQIYSIQI